MQRRVHFNYDLDPETLRSVPDFGFNDELNSMYWEDQTTVWGLLYDQVQKEPKFERIRNLIYQLSIEKYFNVAQKIDSQNEQSHLSCSFSPTKEINLNKNSLTKSPGMKSAGKMLSPTQRRIIENFTANTLNASSPQLSYTEKHFRLKEKYINPITQVFGQKVSSEKIRTAWIRIVEMLLSSKHLT